MKTRGLAMVTALLLETGLALGQSRGAAPVAPDPTPAAQTDAQVSDRLQEPIKELTSEAQPLEKVMRFLSDNTSTGITMDWPALKAAGIGRDAVITLALKNVSMQKCIEAILASADGGKGLLIYQIKDGGVFVTTKVRAAPLTDAQVRDGLQVPLKELTSEGQQLEKVMQFLSDNTDTQITMDWPALKAAGIGRDAAISVALKDVSMQKCIEAILASADGGKGLLIYQIKAGGVFVTTKAAATTRAATMPGTGPATQK